MAVVTDFAGNQLMVWHTNGQRYPVQTFWSPTDTPGLVAWVDASRLNLADGASVTTWPDLSGQGRHLTPVSSAPTFRANARNGLPVVRFDGTLNALQAASTADYRHFFVVAMYRPPAFSNNYPGLVGGLEWLVLTGGSGTNWYPYEQSSCSYYLNGVWAGGAPSDWPVPSGGQYGVMSVARNNGAWSNITLLLGQDRSIVGRNWDGDIVEVIGYDRALTDPERVQVESHLKTKWGIA